jgi:large repetitive protein
MKRLLTMLALVAAVVYAGGISGQVVDATTGEPIAGAQVIAKSVNGDAGRAQTNERGVYRIADLEPGSYKVGAKARGYEEARYPRDVPVRGDQVTEDINFRLAGERQQLGAIAGRITDRRTGEPISGAVIVASRGRAQMKARSDGRGNYLLRGLRPGDYTVTAGARGYARETYPRPVPVTGGNVTNGIDFALHHDRAALD